MALGFGIDSLSRRDFFRLSAAGVTATSLSGWMGVLAARAAATGAKHKRCILLWMDGGPSHKETFDMKPGTPDGGEFKPIDSSAPGIQVSEHLPNVAQLMNHAAVIRSMTTGEGAHGRAKYYMHTGYKEGQGGLVYPSLGSIVSAELGQSESPIPNFVTVGNRSYGAGFLGPRHQPLNVLDAARGIENLRSIVANKQFDGRVGLLEEMERGFQKEYQADSIAAHRTTYQRAVSLMQSKDAKAFDIAQEPSAVRQAYGATKFGEGCLLARRLIETGVSFVEVALGGWDTHQDNFDRVKRLSGQIDPGMSALINDLESRGLLDTTLVVWMGEFGRTPKMNTRGAKPGRDHYPRAWTTVLFGGGIKGGQVVGKTDSVGGTVIDRPVTGIDFMATICTILGVNYTKKNNTPINRPVGIVDKGAKPIAGIVS